MRLNVQAFKDSLRYNTYNLYQYLLHVHVRRDYSFAKIEV